VLRPDVVLELAAQIIAEPTPYLRTRKAAQVTLARLRQAAEQGELTYSKLETRWLDKLTRAADGLPEDEGEFIASILPTVDQSKVRLAEYGIH
jgi:methanol---5-hydroxybenzimidazolylcobamide Co-methyltransferase